jgi:hypothetical protein
MKAVRLEEFGGQEVFAPDQRTYGATTCGTHYERTQKDDEDNRC